MVDNKIPGVASVAQRSGRALKSIKERLVGKQGRVRGNLMGKRCDFTARSVISPDATLKIHELGIPIKVAKTITFPAVVNSRNKKFLTKLLQNGPDVYPGANILEKKGMKSDGISLRYIDRNSQELNEGDVLHRHMLDGDPILFNRQPTLHRMSMMCHKAKVMKEGSTFRMNVADTKPYNADFDGDEMNLHGPQDEESQAELLHLAYVPKQIISPANNSAIIGIFQDSLLGCYRFTRPNINFDLRTAMNLLMYFDNPNLNILKYKKGKRISNFDILTQILPPMSVYNKNGLFEDDENKKTSNNIIEIKNGKYLRGQIDKGILGKGSDGIIQSIFNDYGHEQSAKFIDDIQAIVTEYMKLSSYSVGISDLISDNETTEKITQSINKKKKEVYDLIDQLHISTFENNTGRPNVDVFEDKVNAIVQNAASEAGKIGRANLDKNNRFVLMVNAGSKGSNINIAQMISCLGQQAVDGKRIPYGYEDRTLPHYTKYDDSPEARGFVESSFIQGLTPEETYFHAMGGRTGLIDTAVKTSQTGYIQRRLIKGLEDLKVCYDMTVRNNKNKIIQFSYGDDNIVTTKTETQKLPIGHMSVEQIYQHFQMPDFSQDSTIRFSKQANILLKKQKKDLKNKTKEIINYMLEIRENVVKHVHKYKKDSNVFLPVNFKRIINNIKHNLHIKNNYFIDITPYEVYEKIEQLHESLIITDKIQPTPLFKALMYYYLSPTQLLLKHRFSAKGVQILIDKIIFNFKKAIVHPGEMVGMIAAQSIGEPTTQMSLVGYESINALIKNKEHGKNAIYHHKNFKIGELCDSFIEKYPEYTFPTDHPDSVEIILDKLDEEYYIMGVDENEKTSWNRISHFSRHPVNGDIMTITTKSGRKTTTTLSHSHLTRKDHKVQPIKGSNLQVGMRIPVCKHIDNEFVNKTVEIGDKTWTLNKLFGWFIGAYIAEGNCNNGRVLITNISQHYIDTTTIIGEMFGAKVYVNRRPGEYGPGATTSFSCKELAKFLVKECGPNSFEKKVPGFIFTAPLECKAACIQGYMDGDGNINCDKGHHEIRGCSRSQQLIKDMGLLFNYFDIFATFLERVRHEKPMYYFAIAHGYASLYQKHIGSILKADSLQGLCDYGNRENIHSLSNDVDKIEGLGEIITKCGKDLKLSTKSCRLYNRWKRKKTIGRRTLQKYIKVFKEEIGVKDILQTEIRLLEQAADSGIIWDEIKHIEIYTPDQKEYVYDFTVPANQTFMEDNGVIIHNTLNTFHFAGVASKSNVTRGVPRIEEILSLSENPKQPSTTIYLYEKDQLDKSKAQELKYQLEYTCLKDITKSVSICFDPKLGETLINEDEKLIKQYEEFEKVMTNCGLQKNEAKDFSKWIIRFKLSRAEMLDRGITMDDIHFAIKNSIKQHISCIYNDFNDHNLIFRIRVMEAFNIKKNNTLDQTDEIFKLKNLQENILKNVILRGIKDIPKVLLRKIPNTSVKENGNYQSKDVWVLDTVGSNLKDILTLDNIDINKTFSNDIQEVYKVLGIEAARQCVHNELIECFAGVGKINYHHTTMLCDRICATQKMVSIFRHGINNDDIGPIAKASFEETPEMFLRAAKHAELDLMTGVSANVMCGQEGYFGTGSFQILLNHEEIIKWDMGSIKDEQEINKLLNLEDETTCSKENLIIKTDITDNDNNTGIVDDEYDFDL